jgi:U-box domain
MVYVEGSMLSERESCGVEDAVRNEVIEPADIPTDFLCPITLELMEIPMKSPYGHVFEQKAIQRWLNWPLAPAGTCPLTRRLLRYRDLTPYDRLLTEIDSWRAEHLESNSLQQTGAAAPRQTGAEYSRWRNLKLSDLIREYEEIVGLSSEGTGKVGHSAC